MAPSEVAAAPITHRIVPVLFSSISAALPASCHHPKLGRRPLALKQAYCFQVFVCVCLQQKHDSEGSSVHFFREWLNSSDRNKS